VAEAPDRFGGQMVLPAVGVEAAVAEIDRVIDRPGIRGVLMGCYPNGELAPSSDDDKVWARVVDAGVPLSIHVSLSKSMPAAHRAKLPGYGRFYDAPERMIELIFSGVFDRCPELQIVFAEVDAGWVPYVKEQIDNNFQRLDPVSEFGLQAPPSEYIERHFSFAFITDTFGIRNRHDIGVDRILWSSDYPHISADWPESWRTILASFSGVPSAERDQILAGNAVRLYGFGR
jgi:predicted TIM-barrel fold metal-dependent hydrolase